MCMHACMHIFNGIYPYDKPKVHSEGKFGFPEKNCKVWRPSQLLLLLKSGVLRPETLSILELQKNHGLHDAMVGRSL